MGERLGRHPAAKDVISKLGRAAPAGRETIMSPPTGRVMSLIVALPCGESG
jgi:hypothetical protein